MRALVGLTAMAGLVALGGCEDSGGARTEFEAGDGGLGDGSVASDAAGRLDAAREDAAREDAAPTADLGPVVDAVPPPHLEAPEARIYLRDPTTDRGALSRVVLPQTTLLDGRLTSEWVEVFNCLNEPGGVTAQPNFGGLQITVQLCHEVQVARPGPDGHYLHIDPPADESDPNDSFAELMMYYHVNQAHAYFKGTHDHDGLDYALPALVNVQFKTTPALPIPGLMPGPDGWIPFDNAAYFPKESWELFAAQFGLPPRDSDTIIFFQGARRDFSYDSGVIYHEYGHAVIGNERIRAVAVPDQYGLHNEPNSMHEGLADYFAATILEMAAIGPHVGVSRDLSRPRRCPDDTIDEVHANGRVIGSALWAVRAAIGAEQADAIVYEAMIQFGQQTSFHEAGALMVAEAAAFGPETAATVETILRDYGVIDCVRSRELRDWRSTPTHDGLPHTVEGTRSVGLPGFRQTGVPAYKQFHFDVPADTAGVTLSWTGQTSGGFLGGSSSPSQTALRVALRHDQPVTVNLRGGVAIEADHELTPPIEGGVQTVTLSGACLPAGGGRVHLLHLNPGGDAVGITATSLRLLDDAALAAGGAPNVVDCGGEGPVDPDAGAGDAGAGDAGAVDAGAGDAGAGDSGAGDSGAAVDAGLNDAGLPPDPGAE